MKNFRKISTKVIMMIMVIAIFISTLPIMAAPAEDIPDEMLDNVFLDALEYTGYDLQKAKDDGNIYVYTTRSSQAAYFSDIGYGYGASGLETKIVSGKTVPDIAEFVSGGMCCASYVSYVYFNYLSNIASIDTSDLPRPTNLKLAQSWHDTITEWVSQGIADEVYFTQSADGKTVGFTENPPIGSVITFYDENNEVHHVAIYAGEYNGKHIVTHVGTEDGPCFSTLGGMLKGGQDMMIAKVVTTPDIVFENGNIEIYKKDLSGKNLSGAVFIATDNKTLKKFTIGPTNSNGYAINNEIPFGTYTVTETVFPANYTYGGTTSWTVTVNSTTPTVTINAVNKQKTGTLRVTKSAEDSVKAGFTFRLSGTSALGETVNLTATTDISEIATFSNVPVGTSYTISETNTPVRYIVPQNQTATIEWDKVTNITYINNLKKGYVELLKVDEDNGGTTPGLSGAVFGIYKATDDTKVSEITTGVDGKAKSGLLPYGDYYLQEITAPNGYVKNDNKYPFSITTDGETVYITASNIEQRAKLTITKIDNITGNSQQGDATLNGAVFQILDKDKNVVETLTCKDGENQISSSNLKLGKYFIQEVTSPVGYTLNTELLEVNLTYSNQNVVVNLESVNFENKVIQGKVAITKHDDKPNNDSNGNQNIENPMRGVEFKIWLKSAGTYENAKESERQMVITDEDGYAETKPLPYGTYICEEQATEANKGHYIAKAFEVVIDKDGKTYSYIIKNEVIKTYVKIVKKDAETKEIIPADGIEFKIKDLSTGEYVKQQVTYPVQTVIDTFSTVKGMLVTPQKLPYGKYELVEIKAPYGYVLSDTPVTFEIGETQEETVEIEFFNTASKGKVEIYKVGNILSSADKQGDIYVPRWEERGLEGVKYNVIADEDIYTQDGTLRYAEGTIVDTVVTNADGMASSKELYLGKYYAQEVETIEQYVLDNTKQYFSLEYKDQTTKIVTSKLALKNIRQTVSLELTKQMEEAINAPYGFNPYQNVVFGLYAKNDILNYEGAIVIPADGLVGKISVDENGKGNFSCELPFCEYYIREISTNPIYVIDESVYPIKVEYQGQEITDCHIKVNNGEAIVNRLKRGEIQVYKTDGKTKMAIKDVMFALTTVDGKEIARGRTDENGYLLFDNLPYGEYMLKELEAAKDYIINNRIEKLVIDDVTPAVKTIWENEKFEIPKTGDKDIVFFVIILAVAGLLGEAAVLLKRKYKNGKNDKK